MRKSIICGIAAAVAPTFGGQNTLAQETRKLRTIQGNYNDTATIAPTNQRVKSLTLPAGFSVAKFAEIANPRMLAVANDGTIYVSQCTPRTLSMLRDTNGDGVADIQKVVAEKKQMHGVYVDGGKIYLVTVKEVFVADIKADGTLGELKMLIDDLPDAGQHPNRSLAVNNGKIWITVGSTCNACDESTPEAATILTTDLNGKYRQIYASGLRNTIGFGWHPVSNKLFGMDHGIDMLGDNDQEEELNEIKRGTKYGWAYVYANAKLNPHNVVPKELGLTNADWTRQSGNPVLLYTPHAAPMQMAFNTGEMFPAEYKNDAFVAMRGSWNRVPPSGYEVVRIRFEKSGNPQKIEPFLTGFLVKGGAPADKPYNYHFQIFAPDTKLNLPSGFNRQALLDAMKNHVIAKGEIVGTYQRKPDVREKK